MLTNHNGGVPGSNTPESDKGVVTVQGNNPQRTTSNSAEFKLKLIASYARIKDLASGFYIQRGIGIEAIAMLILVAVFATVRAFR